MKLQFDVSFRRGTKEVALISGMELPSIVAERLTVGELVEKVIETEQFLEKLTGYRVHINQVA